MDLQMATSRQTPCPDPFIKGNPVTDGPAGGNLPPDPRCAEPRAGGGAEQPEEGAGGPEEEDGVPQQAGPGQAEDCHRAWGQTQGIYISSYMEVALYCR